MARTLKEIEHTVSQLVDLAEVIQKQLSMHTEVLKLITGYEGEFVTDEEE